MSPAESRRRPEGVRTLLVVAALAVDDRSGARVRRKRAKINTPCHAVLS